MAAISRMSPTNRADPRSTCSRSPDRDDGSWYRPTVVRNRCGPATGESCSTVAPGPGPMMRMMVVDVTLGDVFTAGRPRVLWEAMRARYPARHGRQNLRRRAGRPALPDDSSRETLRRSRHVTHVVLVQNWLEELKRLAPRN